MMKDKVIKDILYIFVNLNDQQNPDYYIALSHEARKKVKQYKTRGILILSAMKSDDFLSRWDKLELVKKTLNRQSANRSYLKNLDCFNL